jgi:hypothetical protein
MRFRTFRTILLVVFAAACVFMLMVERPAQGQANSREQITQRQWEYTYDILGAGFSDHNVPRIKMALFGAKGWELVTVYRDGTQAVAIYKRPKQ